MSGVSRITIAFVLALTSQLGATPASADCPNSPDTSCKFAGSASFSYKNSATDTKDGLTFRLSKGAATEPADFGDPTASTSYDLCVYAGGESRSPMVIPADGDCSDGACWATKPKGPAYKSKTGQPDGITGITLVAADADDKTKIVVKGKGEELGDLFVPADQPIDEPIVIQLRNSIDGCWGAIFEGPEQVQQDVVKGTAKAKAKLAVLPTCSDTVVNGFESDVDCGGACSDCGYQRNCNADTDCISHLCSLGTCAASCNDGVLNGDETGLDCGGSCGATCVYGDNCDTNSDCASDICRNDSCSAKLVFVTSTSYTGNLGGLAGADAKCNTRAAAGGWGGTWAAWLSTTNVSAIDRIADHEYRRIDGLVVFANKAQIASSLPSASIDFNEFGQDVFNVLAWTNSSNSGQPVTGDCSAWMSTSGSSWVGQPNTPINWSSAGTSNCSDSRRLICFEQ